MLRIATYLGDYGPANVWANLKDDQIKSDLNFYKRKSINTLILLIPYATFKPGMESFESENADKLQRVLDESKVQKLNVIFRIGYLWDTNFLANRTLERYIDIYKHYRMGKKSIYEEDFITFVRFFCDNFATIGTFLSWEDFFWPVLQAEDKNEADWVTEEKTKQFIEYLLSKIERDNLCVEQRTNRFFKRINHNGKYNYGYFNYICNYDKWCALVEEGGIIEDSLVPEKGFIEWLSIMIKNFQSGNEKKFIIDQFNLIDNTFDDDKEFHHHKNQNVEKCRLDLTRAISFLDFTLPLIRKYVHGLGFWNLWTVPVGHIYNGTFIMGAKGWETSGSLGSGNDGLVLIAGQVLSTSLGYVRIGVTETIKILLDYQAQNACELKIIFNKCERLIELKPGRERVVIPFSGSVDRKLQIECLKGEVKLIRIDCFKMYLKSFLFDENRNPTPVWSKLEELWV